MSKKYILIIFLILSSLNLAQAQNNEISQKSTEIEAKKELKLNDILFYTYENNEELKAEREKLKAVEMTKLKTFGTNALPNFYLNATRGKRNLKTTTAGQEYEINHNVQQDSLVLSQPIFKSGRTMTSLKAVDNQIQIQKNTLDSKEQEILFDAIVASVNILRTKIIYDITKQNEESLKKGYEYSLARRKVGKTTITEVYTSKSRYKEALSNTANARTDMLIAKANFKQIVGLNSEYINMKEIDKLFKTINNYRTSQDEVIEKSLSNNPDFLIYKENYKLNKNNLNFNKTDFLPTLTLNAGASRAKSYSATTRALSKSREGFVNLDLKVPLIQSGVKYADYKAGRHSLNQSRFEMKNAKKAIQEQAIQAYEEFLLSKELIKTAEAYMDATKIALNASTEESKVGKITIIDVLDRRREYFESQIEVIEAKSNNILKFYSLKVLIGEMNLTNLETNNNGK